MGTRNQKVCLSGLTKNYNMFRANSGILDHSNFWLTHITSQKLNTTHTEYMQVHFTINTHSQVIELIAMLAFMDMHGFSCWNYKDW